MINFIDIQTYLLLAAVPSTRVCTASLRLLIYFALLLLVMESISLLTNLQPSSKDGKTIVSALVDFFKSYEAKILSMFSDMHSEFIELMKSSSEKVKQVEMEVTTLKKKIAKLEDKLEDSEAYERRDTLLFSGKKLPVSQVGEICSQVVLKSLSENLNLSISLNDISVAHRIGPKPKDQKPDQRKIIVKFCKRDVKNSILAAARRVKPQDFYVNESLTPQRQDIYFGIRKAKREFPDVISGCTTIDGSVYDWLKSGSSAPGARDLRLQMNNFDRFSSFCEEKFQKPASYFTRKQ